ncbi:class I SAM-dependent methyltransferase [Brevundimonas sp.]|uniref:class I SAM-dependent methyltransferase n=1 Tax=Brevundimonas sp. TaxID=1871086 RepID=UPI0027378F60|nr:class I SAM-dependent methyltransferase [Brevundimonas sp.]MDP3801868.1 methyltransferase domain-containing protein [Brevundimonas sp.]
MKSGQEANEAQARLWNARVGEVWVEQQELLDRLLQPFERALVEVVANLGAGDVLDVGCGAGATTLGAARHLGERGRCTGVDISVPLIEAARRRAEAAGLETCRFIAADAQQYAFEPAAFDGVISRFGVMFFADPVAAFANIRRAARPDAGLAFIAWRSAEENPFMTAAERAAAPLLPELPARDPAGPGQFAFADAERVRGILAAAGWRDVDIQPLDLVVTLSAVDLDAYAARMGPVGALLPDLDEDRRSRIVAAVRQAFEAWVTSGAAHITTACWLVRARNPG